MKIKRLTGALALLCGVAGQAQAESCWDQHLVEAAQIRQLDIMLMVSTLRCQVKGVDFVPEYNAFVVSNKTMLVANNDELLRHFNASMSGRAAYDAYDRFSTGMANQFGNGGGQPEDCETLRAMTVAATATGAAVSSRESLLGQAQRAGMDLAVPGGRCGTIVASAETAVAVPGQQYAMSVPADH